MSTAHAIVGFNAFRYQQHLKQAKIPADQADVFAAAFEAALEPDVIELATKADLDRKADQGFISELATKSDISKLEVRVLLYLSGLAAFLLAGMAALAGIMGHGFSWW